jgi:hypothetical protein
MNSRNWVNSEKFCIGPRHRVHRDGMCWANNEMRRVNSELAIRVSMESKLKD